MAAALARVHIDILGVTETWQGRCATVPIPGYKFIGKPRADGRGGGVGFYVAAALLPLVTPVTSTTLPESMWLQVTSCRASSPPLCIGLVYIPPSALHTATDISAAFTAFLARVPGL